MDPRPTPVNASDLASGAPPLASHATFLRSLAKNLLFDKSAAGDVAQRALLLALQRERSRDGPSRCARGSPASSATSHCRAAVKSAAAPSASASPRAAEATSSAADEVARLEIMERLLAAVRRLEPVYRTTVMLRFFDQLKPGAIAKRTGVPVETVRTRLKRGLERLRVELDARHGGDRSAWGLLLLPTALPAGGGVLGGVVGKVTGSVALHALAVGGIGALAMSSKIKLLIGGVVALAATAVIVQFTRDDGARRLAARRASHATPLAAPAEAKAPPAQPRFGDDRGAARARAGRTRRERRHRPVRRARPHAQLRRQAARPPAREARPLRRLRDRRQTGDDRGRRERRRRRALRVGAAAAARHGDADGRRRGDRLLRICRTGARLRRRSRRSRSTSSSTRSTARSSAA